MTIKELYEYAKVKGFENLPFRYGYIDYDGICRLQDFYLPDSDVSYKCGTYDTYQQAVNAVNELVERINKEKE